MSNSWVELTIKGDLAHLELARVKRGNALDRKFTDDVVIAVDTVVANKNIRGLLITAQGSSFCVGGDLGHLVEHFDTLGEELEYMIRAWHSCLLSIANLPIPVVVGVQGGVGGGGLGLVWCADHVIAADNTSFATGFSDIGITGDGGNSWHLPRLIGMRRAKEMLLENRVVDAATALDWGLVNRVVSLADLKAQSYRQAQIMSSRSITSIGAMKQLLLESSRNTYEQQLQAELDCVVACTQKNDVKIGMKAFVARKKAVFSDCLL